MKKTLIALAALAATGAFAQSSVTLGGNLDLGFNQTDYKGNTVNTAAAQNGSSTSVIVFKGTEDLGGGLNAGFQWEAGLNLAATSGATAGTPAVGTGSNVASFLANGNSFVSLGGGFGTVKLGTPNLSTLGVSNLGNGGFSTAIGSGYRVSSFDAVRLPAALRYESPNFGGFTAALHYVAKADKATTATSNRDGAAELGLGYANGPLNIQAAYLETDQATTLPVSNAKFRLTSLAAGYKVGAFNVAAFLQRATSDTLSSGAIYDRNTTGIAFGYDVTPAVNVKLNYQRVAVNGGETGTGATANEATTVLGLGVDYAMSKRTSLYGRYERDEDKAGLRSITGYTAGVNNTTYGAFQVGVRHAF